MSLSTAAPFDPLDAGFNQDPYDQLAALQDQFPIYRLDALGAWVVTRYDDVAFILRDGRATTDIRSFSGHTPPSEGGTLSPSEWFTVDAVLRGDSGRHARLRRLVARTFAARAVEQARSDIQDLIDDVLVTLPAKGEIDAVQDFARRIPGPIVTRLIGVPLEHEQEFCAQARTFTRITNPLRSPADTEQLDAAILELRRYIEGLIIEREREPRAGDLLSDLIQGREDGERLSHDELLKLCMAVLAAGTETLTSLISIGILTLVEEHEELSGLLAHPETVETVVLELLRYRMMGKFIVRFMREDLELSGMLLKRGDLVLACPVAAHRDPRVFPQPERFDPRRDLTRIIPFGLGEHRCIGTWVAMLGASCSLLSFFRRFPTAQLRVRSAEVAWTNELFARAPVTLPVVLRTELT